MKKEELVNIISARLNSQGKETAVAFDVFLQKVAESLQVNESVKIPDVGIFQLKRKGSLDDSAGQGKSSFYLLFVPLKYNRKDKNEVLAFQVNPRNIKKTELDDDVFSLSVDQPVIPVTEQARKDFLVHSSYLMMQKNFEERVDGLLLNSLNLSDFEIDYKFPSSPGENIFDLAPETENETGSEDNESIPWDFGEEADFISDENTPETEITPEPADENADEDFDAIVAKITGGFSDDTSAFDDAEAVLPDDMLDEDSEIFEENDEEPGPQSETEEVLNEIMPEDNLNLPADELFRNLLGEEEITEDEIPEDEVPEDKIPGVLPGLNASDELGDDWFSLKEIDEEEELVESETPFAAEEPSVKEDAFENEEPAVIDDQAENIDDKLELLTEMDAGLEIDPFEDFALDEEDEIPEEITDEVHEEEIPEEEPLEEEPLEEELPEEELPAEEPDLVLEKGGLHGVALTDEKMLEDEDEAGHKVKYPGMFWMILGALVLVTLGGIYYFFFMGNAKLPVPDFAKKVTSNEAASVKPQVIERDYSVPVTVYKRSREKTEPENSGDQTNSAIQNNSTAQNNAPAQNNPAAENKTASEGNVKGNNTAQKTETPKKVQENKPIDKQQLTKLPEAKLPETSKQGVKNNPVVKSNPVVQNVQTPAEVQIQPGSDTKNKLIKEYIFTDGRGRYTIQESSWQSMAEAVKRVKYFRSKGLDAYYTKYAPRGEKVWYRVRIGDYPSLEETENTLRKIK
ncbi:MAG: SPOR domain-containing protein [Syntrophomonadaceae bacterium]